ncbi:penicillin-binding protein [Streptomyces griseocarneus]|nr:penicillin-binding protein [Streptomyces griseocarneus]
MNKPVRRIAIFCGLLTLALLLRSNWLQFVQADSLKTNKHNHRVAIARYSHPRGDIIVDGKAVTGSLEVNGIDYKYRRSYTNGEMWAPVTGYSSQVFDGSQLEKLYDKILTGDDDKLFFNRTVDMFTGKAQKGGDIITTLNSKAQEAAFKGLGDKRGAVAALDPRTGKILALASTPSYDPSKIAGGGKSEEANWTTLEKDKNQPMLNRALRATYPPGSTFKVVTAAAALENGLYTDPDQRTQTPAKYVLPDSVTPLQNEGNIQCENVSMREALRISCNTVFGKISADLGNAKMKKQAEKFGFNNEVLTPVRAEKSVYPKDNRPQNAMDGIGQASNRATPLQMAMVVSAIANNGKLMEPYMVDKVRAPNLNIIETHQPKQMGQPLSAANAQKIQSMMETVVKEGTGKNGQIDTPGVTVGGKTGTAQHGVDNSGNPYAWFISYAKTDNGSPVAVAVVIEGDNETARDDIAGGALAAPIAKNVMEAVLSTSK